LRAAVLRAHRAIDRLVRCAVWKVDDIAVRGFDLDHLRAPKIVLVRQATPRYPAREFIAQISRSWNPTVIDRSLHRRHVPISQQIIAMLPVVSPNASLAAIRDRALRLLGFAGAFRRSELVALDLADVEECPEGLRITIRKSKTDQEGAGQVIAIPRGMLACPAVALRAWLVPPASPAAARLTDRSVAKIVKAHAARAGLDPAKFAGHSLRSGFLTSAAARVPRYSRWPTNPGIRVWTHCAATSATRKFSRITLERDCCKSRLIYEARRLHRRWPLRQAQARDGQKRDHDHYPEFRAP
jgi:integrase